LFGQKAKIFFQVQNFFGPNSNFFKIPNYFSIFQIFLGSKIQIFGPNFRILFAIAKYFDLFARIHDREILRFAVFLGLASRWITQKVFHQSWKWRFGDHREKIR
jgi:hypothetical protein